MSERFECLCGLLLEAPAERLGWVGTCPGCGRRLRPRRPDGTGRVAGFELEVAVECAACGRFEPVGFPECSACGAELEPIRERIQCPACRRFHAIGEEACPGCERPTDWVPEERRTYPTRVEVLLCYGLMLLCMMAAFFGAGILFRRGVDRHFLLLGIETFGIGLPVGLILLWRRWPIRRVLPFRAVSAESLVWCALAGVLGGLAVPWFRDILLEYLPHLTEIARRGPGFLPYDPSWGDVIALIGHAALLTALIEELAFRGLILTGLFQDGARQFGSILLTSALFAAIHLSGLSFLLIFVFGVVLGYLRTRSGSLWPPIVMHAAYNTTVFLGTKLGEPLPILSVVATIGLVLALVRAFSLFRPPRYATGEPGDDLALGGTGLGIAVAFLLLVGAWRPGVRSWIGLDEMPTDVLREMVQQEDRGGDALLELARREASSWEEALAWYEKGPSRSVRLPPWRVLGGVTPADAWDDLFREAKRRSPELCARILEGVVHLRGPDRMEAEAALAALGAPWNDVRTLLKWGDLPPERIRLVADLLPPLLWSRAELQLSRSPEGARVWIDLIEEGTVPLTDRARGTLRVEAKRSPRVRSRLQKTDDPNLRALLD